MISASQLGRIAACPGSEHLPQVRRESPASKAGTVVHAFMQAANEKGMAGAIAEVPPEYLELCQLIGLESLPHGKGEFASEVAFAFDPVTLTAREVGRGINRSYAAAGVRDTEVGGTADLVGVTETAVIVGDIKTGFGWQEADSWQLRALAVMAAITYDREEAYTFALLIRPGEEPYRITHKMDALDIAKAATELAALVKRVKASNARDLNAGDWCKWCPSLWACPAQTKIIRDLALSTASPMTAADSAAQLTMAEARITYQRAEAAAAGLKRVWEVLDLVARQQPIDLGNGKVYGLKEKTTESIDGSKAHHVLKEKYGVEFADSVVTMEATKKALKEALTPLALAKGIPLSKMDAEALAALKEAGAIRSRTKESLVEYKGK